MLAEKVENITSLLTSTLAKSEQKVGEMTEAIGKQSSTISDQEQTIGNLVLEVLMAKERITSLTKIVESSRTL